MKISVVPKKIPVMSYPGLVLRSFLAGLLSGAVVSAFNFVAGKLSEVGAGIYSQVRGEPLWLLLALPMAGALGLISYLLLRFDPDVSGSDRFANKPLHLDEALMQLENIGGDFFVFINAETTRVNVVYRKSAGGFALIDPVL